MRRDWRNVLLQTMLFLLGTTSAIARQEPGKHGGGPAGDFFRVTIELTWGISNPEIGPVDASDAASRLEQQPEFTLEVTNGRVIDLIDWPTSSARVAAPTLQGTPPTLERAWKLGRGPEGRVRARIEASADSSLMVRGGAQAIGIPLAAVLERPQRTPPQSRLVVTVERLPWDSIVIDLGESARDGIVAPGATVPVSVGYNILWPDVSEVSVRTSAVLRPAGGGDVLWRDDPREAVNANVLDPPSRIWNVRAPRIEGTYVLEVRANWEPTAGREESRLARLIRRHKPGMALNSAVRRVAFTVVDPAATLGGIGAAGLGRDTEVDSVDLSRLRSHRPVATGRSSAFAPGSAEWGVPGEALIEPSRRDRVRGWFLRNGGEAAKLDAADAGGLAWTAVGLKVTHPDRPHRLSLKIKGGEPSALGVALFEASTSAAAGAPPRLLLDACASGPPILLDGPAASFEWVVFPHSSEVLLLLVNRSPEAEVRAGAITLSEIDEATVLPPGPEPVRRALGLYLTGPSSLDRFGASASQGSNDALRTAQNLVKYLGYCGATAVVLPEDVADRAARRRLDGQADEDPTGPDCLEMVRRILARANCALWLELQFEGAGAFPGLPAVDSPEALERGLVRIDSHGRPDGPAFHPLNTEVRQAMKQRVTTALVQLKAHQPGSPGGGLVIRLGPGPTLLGTPDTGLDDKTYQKFTHDTFGPENTAGIPGVEFTDPDRFAVRSRYVAGVGRMPWLTWRSKEIAALYADLNAAVRSVAPAARLAVVTPSLDGGPAGREARRVDRAALPPSQSWRSVGFDLQSWPSGPASPLVLRGTALSTEALSHDLANSPDLDSLVAARPVRGLLLSIGGESTSRDSSESPSETEAAESRLPEPGAGNAAQALLDRRPPLEIDGRATDKPGSNPRVWLSALPLGDGPAADLPLGHALAALDAQWVFLAEKAVSGQEERLRNFARVLGPLPAKAVPADLATDGISPPFGVVVRSLDDNARTFLEIANNSPYPIRLACGLDVHAAAPIEDVGRGLRLNSTAGPAGSTLALDLLPYGVAAIRIAAPNVRVASVNTYPSEAVMAAMRTRFNELSAQLARLNHGLSATPAEPANPGFEPGAVAKDTAPREPLVKAVAAPVSAKSELSGWLVLGATPDAGSIEIDRENPHSGQGSMKLSSGAAASSVVSESFVPNISSSLTIEAFFRAKDPGTKVRVWIEGESGGKPYVRRTEMTVSTEWEGRAVRASDVPAGGLEKARLRFELLAPGSLWIDDLHLPSEATSKSGLLNARRTLLAAAQAYREERYAEFARLAGSHWIQESSAAATTRLARTPEVSSRPGGGATRSSDSDPSALPPDRKRR